MCLVCGCDEPNRSRRPITRRDPEHPEPDELIIEATEQAPRQCMDAPEGAKADH